jgi:hypothetical protein
MEVIGMVNVYFVGWFSLTRDQSRYCQRVGCVIDSAILDVCLRGVAYEPAREVPGTVDPVSPDSSFNVWAASHGGPGLGPNLFQIFLVRE